MQQKFNSQLYILAKYGQEWLDQFEEDFGHNGWDLLTSCQTEAEVEAIYNWGK